MIYRSEDKQFSLDETGHISWQPDTSNPLPGTPVAVVGKGPSLLAPSVAVLEDKIPDEAQRKVIAQKLEEWLDGAVKAVLAPLFNLEGGDPMPEPARAIIDKLYESLGIVPRGDLDAQIAALDEEGRKALRARKVRMGPLLIFLPELNKPAAVKLRATLLTLWAGKDLPAEVPNDGMVSLSVTGKEVDKDYYRAIGYPVYGPRAIRVDMLDRVVCAVYDAAKGGKFQAQHQMAEWMGSNIADLYAVLEAMGHTKIHDPLDEKIKAGDAAAAPAPIAPVGETPAEQPAEKPVEQAPEQPAEQPASAAETPAAEIPAAEAAATEVAAPAAEPTEPAKPARPELATFRLKRGKASDSAAKKPFVKRDRPPRKDGDKPAEGGKRPFKGKPKDGKDGEKRPFKGKPRDRDKDRDRDRGRFSQEDRVVASSAPTAKPEDSPFAILQQLKLGNEGK